jgi:predicted Fe-Mo cluster-binding NifX family protein
MKVAIPVHNGLLAMHFGHCAEFAVMEVVPATGEISRKEMIAAPPHEPGLLPRWLAEKDVKLIIAGGMGGRARDLFTEQQITVITGAPAATPEILVRDYFAGNLQTGENACDH